MTPSLETKLAQIVNALEGANRCGGLHRTDGHNSDYLRAALNDAEVQNWIDDMNRQGRVTKGLCFNVGAG